MSSLRNAVALALVLLDASHADESYPEGQARIDDVRRALRDALKHDAAHLQIAALEADVWRARAWAKRWKRAARRYRTRAAAIDAPAADESPWDPEPIVHRDLKPDNLRRNRRPRAVRGVTVNVKRGGLRLRLLTTGAPVPEQQRPLTRGECLGGERPCPFVSCKYHLFLDVSPGTGAIKLNFPDLIEDDGGIRLEEMPATCALDVADEGGVTSDRVGACTNLTRARIQQMEAHALELLQRRAADLREYL